MNSFSTTVLTPRLNSMGKPNPGGMIEMELKGISGPEATPTTINTPVSAELKIIASITHSSATATQWPSFKSMTTVGNFKLNYKKRNWI